MLIINTQLRRWNTGVFRDMKFAGKSYSGHGGICGTHTFFFFLIPFSFPRACIASKYILGFGWVTIPLFRYLSFPSPSIFPNNCFCDYSRSGVDLNIGIELRSMGFLAYAVAQMCALTFRFPLIAFLCLLYLHFFL